MKRAGSVGPQVPLTRCHCRVTLSVPWMLWDMFLASVASMLVMLDRRPRPVVLLENLAAVRVDEAEAAERLVRSRRVDAVDVDQRVAVPHVAPRAGDVEADAAGELPREPDDELVDERVVQVLVELDARTAPPWRPA